MEYAKNSLLPLGAYTVFRGVAVDNTSVLIAYTWGADADLDGLVDDDVTIVTADYPQHLDDWAQGDFDFDGQVDDDDTTVLGALYPQNTPA